MAKKPFRLEPEDAQTLFYSRLAKAIEDGEKMDRAMRDNPELAKQKIKRYQERYKKAKEEAQMGNVASKEDMKILKNKIDDLYRKFLPDEWQKIQDRKARARARPRVRKSTKKVVNTGLNVRQAAEKNPEVARKLALSYREFRVTKYASPDIVYNMLSSAKVSITRSVLQNLSKQELEQVKEIASQIQTEARPLDAYTEKQKQQVIKILDSEIAKK